jgi:hypothetical protein
MQKSDRIYLSIGSVDMSKKLITTWFPKDLATEAEKKAEQQDLSTAQLVRRAVKEYCEKEGNK